MSARPAPARSGGAAACATPAVHSTTAHANGGRAPRRNIQGRLSSRSVVGAGSELELHGGPGRMSQRRAHPLLALEATLEEAAFGAHLDGRIGERPRRDAHDAIA